MALGVTAAFPIAVAIALPRAQLPTRSALVLLLSAAAILTAYRVAFMLSSAVAPAECQVFAGAPLLHAMPAVLPLAWHLVGFGVECCLLRKGGGLVDAPGRGLVGVKGNSPIRPFGPG
jgi:hypothetical protein